jgi:hypothetical protein
VLFWIQGAPTTNPVIFLNAFAQVSWSRLQRSLCAGRRWALRSKLPCDTAGVSRLSSERRFRTGFVEPLDDGQRLR